MRLEEVRKYLKEAYKYCKKLGGRIWIDETSIACLEIDELKMMKAVEYGFTTGDFRFEFDVPWRTTSELSSWKKVSGIHWDNLRIVGRMDTEKWESLGWECKEKGGEVVCRIYREFKNGVIYSTGDWDLTHDLISLTSSLVMAGRAIAALSKEELQELRRILKELE